MYEHTSGVGYGTFFGLSNCNVEMTAKDGMTMDSKIGRVPADEHYRSLRRKFCFKRNVSLLRPLPGPKK